jgi:hypothetical protein
MVVLSEGFIEPGGVFFEGAAAADSALVPAVFPVAIHGHPYNIEPSLYRRSFANVQRPAQDQTREPGETSLSPEGIWRRSQSDWSLGAGQIWLDEEESIRRRVRTSLGIDLFNDREISLLPETEEKRTSANTNLKVRTYGAYVYIMDGANILFSNGSGSEQNATWVTGWTTATGLPGGTLLDMTSSGNHVYVLASDNSIYRATLGTTSFAGPWYNPTAVLTKIYAGLGRLFGSVNNLLYEITATPGETLIFTHPDPTYTFDWLGAAPTGIYFSGRIGSSGLGELRHTWVRDDGTAFVAPVVAAEFRNEPINCIEATGNIALIGTTKGLRMAQIDGISTGLSFGPPITALGDVRDICFDSTTSFTAELFAWCTWTNIVSGTSGLARIRVARQTETLVPAYASDIYTTSSATIISCCSLSGRRYFAASADGFFGANANKVATGNFTTGRLRYGLLSSKIYATMQWRTAPLEGAIGVTGVLDTDSTIIIGNQSTAGSTGTDMTRLPSAESEWLEMTFTLTRDGSDATKGPKLRWWVLRAVPTPEAMQVFIVPLRLEQKTQTPNGAIQMVNVFEELDFISDLVRTQRIVRYQEGLAAYDVHVVNMEHRPEQWERMDSLLEGLTLVELHTVT